jgi:LysR family transcriptional regulator for metE and metH
MVATPEGQRLLSTAERVLAEVADAEHDLRRYRDGVRGVLRLATECYTCYHWLPPLLKRFHETFPEVEVSLVPEATLAPFEALSSDRLDVAVVHSVPSDASLAATPLFTDELVLVVAPGHRLSARPFVVAEDLADEVLLLHTGPDDSVLFTEVLDPAGVRPRRVLSMKLTEAVLESAKAGLGVSAVARWAAAPDLERGTLVAIRITEAGLQRTWSIVTRRRDERRKPVARLVELMKEGPLPARAPASPGSRTPASAGQGAGEGRTPSTRKTVRGKTKEAVSK